jgi:nucleoside-diphosphate-sugar epimerase
MSRICLVTGASGFVGSALMREVLRRGQLEGLVGRGAVRVKAFSSIQTSDSIVVGDINEVTNWRQALADVDVVVHAAARAHVLKKDSTDDPIAVFRSVNVIGTVNLAEQALRAGIRRFIFVSSIGVNGNQTFGKAFCESDIPKPQEPYAISKFEAEVALRDLFSGPKAQLVIVRPPLVYGPNPPGNFRRLLNLAASGLPLPLGAIHNKRSFVGLDNLVDLIITCLDHPAAANQTFLVSDDEDISTTELLRRMGSALGKPARLLPVPVWMLEAGAALLGKRELSQRLCGNLQVDISKAKDLLGWSPPVSVDEGLRVTAERFLAGLSK